MELEIKKGMRFSDLFKANTIHGFLIWMVIVISVFAALFWFLIKSEVDTSVYDKKSKLNTYRIIIEKNNGIVDTLFMKSLGEITIDEGPNYDIFIIEKGENFIGASITNRYNFENIKKYSIKKIKGNVR